jgi:hypothetical protein
VLALGVPGCQTPRGGDRPGGMKVTDVGGYLEFVARDRRREQDSKVSDADLEYTETIFQQNVKLETEGYVYHPNLLEFAAAGLFGLMQHSYEQIFAGRRDASRDTGYIYGFDLRGDFLQRKPYPGSVFAQRSVNLEPRPFLSSLETTTTNFGLTWQYVNETYPTSFQISHTDVQLDPLSDEESDGRQKNTNVFFETGYNISEHNAFNLTLSYLSVEEEPYDLNYDQIEFTLAHRLNFGDGHRHRLESELNYLDQTGTFDIERFRWRERLRLEHTDTLRSVYQFELQQRNQGLQAGVPPLEETSYRFSAMLEHELYESLVTQVGGYLDLSRFDPDLDIDQYGAYLTLDYQKRNPLGLLEAEYRFRVEREERSGSDLAVDVLDEPHTFENDQPEVLANPNVIQTSILVTSDDRTVIYVQGRDYIVRVEGDRTQLELVITGRIQNGQTVLVSYTYLVLGDFTLDTLAQDFGISQLFDFGLRPYYRLRWQDQDISPDRAAGALAEDITAHIVGAEYRWRTLRLFAEFEDRDSNITPYRAVRVGGDYTHRFQFGGTAIARARWTDYDYFPPNERELTTFTAEGRYRHPITNGLTVEGAVLYRHQDDSLVGEEDGVDVDLTLEWIIRQTEVRATFEYGTYDDVFASDDHTGLYVQVRRRF